MTIYTATNTSSPLPPDLTASEIGVTYSPLLLTIEPCKIKQVGDCMNMPFYNMVSIKYFGLKSH